MSPKRIVIVEDDPNFQKIYRLSLENAGFEVAIDELGDALPNLLREQTDLIILDVHVPLAWGPDTVQWLKENPETASIPRLVTTADIITAKQLEQDGETVLTKPISVARLVSTVQQILG